MSEKVMESSDSHFIPSAEQIDSVSVTVTKRRRLGRRCVQSADATQGIDVAMDEMTEQVDEVFEKQAPREDDGKLLERDGNIAEMVKRYKDHPYVENTVARHRNKTPLTYISYSKLVLKRSAAAYDLLTDQEFDDYFRKIDRGVKLYEDVGLDNLGPQQEKIIIDLVAARQAIFAANLRLVVYYAGGFKGQYEGMDELDVIQSGNIGLKNAINRFDIERGFKFSTYAKMWIVQAIRRAICNQSRNIKFPMHKYEAFARTKKKLDKLQAELGREPTDEEAFDATGLTKDKLELQKRQNGHSTSLNFVIGDGTDGTEICDLISDDSCPDSESLAEDVTYRQMLNKLIDDADLDPRVKAVVGLRFNLDQFDGGDFTFETHDGNIQSYEQVVKLAELRVSQTLKELTLNDMGGIFRISRERVRQLETQGLAELKKAAIEGGYENLWKTKKSDESAQNDDQLNEVG